MSLKEDLKTYEVNDALRIIEGANDVIGGLDEKKLGVVTKQLEEAKNAADNAERTQAEFYQAARDREESAQETSRKTRELSESISIKKGEIDILKNTIAGNETLTERIQNELKEIMGKEAFLTQRSGTEQEAGEKGKTLLQIEEEIDRLTELSVLAEGGAGEQNSEIEELNSFVAVQIERLSELKIALSNQKITRESYLARKETHRERGERPQRRAPEHF